MRVKPSAINWRSLTYNLPLILPVGLTVFGLTAELFLLIGQFRLLYVLPIGMVTALTAMFLVMRYQKPIAITRSNLIWSIVVMIFALGWVAVNMHYASQHIYTNRDPGVYANGGLWLIGHDQMQISRDGVFQGVDNTITEASPGFGISRVNGEELYTQGAHLLPIFMGLAGRIAGVAASFKIPPILAGFALLALYGFARTVTREKWAFIAMATFAVSLPVIYFSRDSYSEMLATTFTFSSLALFVGALRVRHRLMWILAGMAAGASQLVRIDGILSMTGMMLALFIYLILADKTDRRERTVNFVTFMISMIAVSGIGILDLMLLSSGYFNDLRHQVTLELIAAVGVFILGCVLVGLAWRSSLFMKLNTLTASWRAKWAAIIAVAVCILLATRPLWMVSRSKDMESLRPFIESLQVALGSPVDGYRTYAEQTINWLAWYTGPVLVVLAAVGVGWVIYRAMSTKDLRWWAMVGVIVGAAAVYLNKPAITPDQIWASRRMLPVIMPGVAVLGVIGLEWIENRKKLPWKMSSTAVVSVLATLAIVGPMVVSASFLTVRTHVPELAQMKTVCEKLPGKSAVVWMGRAAEISVQPTRGLCGVPAAGTRMPISTRPALGKLAENIRKSGHVPIVGMVKGGGAASRDETPNGLQLVSAISTNEYQSTLERPPHRTVTGVSEVWLGVINDDGTISPIDMKERE